MDIAIVGMAGRFPEARNVEEFYKNLCGGKDSVREISDERKKRTSISLYQDYQLMAYMDDIDLFDYDFFNISLGEAQIIDPHQRLLLEVVYEALENSGYSADYYNGTNTSVFIGDVNQVYYKHIGQSDATTLVSGLNSTTASRISRFFNLRGGASMIDTSCSSSLVALHYACNELMLGNSDHALVCGVKLNLFPALKKTSAEVGIEAPDGKTKAFSAAANGTGSGEAVNCILIKRLDDAIREKNIIHCVIKGIAINQDAALSASIAAPDSIAQSEVIVSAWKKAGIDPEKIGYIEAHGTGTKLGDPIEVEGINLAFKKYTDKNRFCAVSSIKTNIGHTDSAAGMSGLIKAVLTLKYKKLLPSLHFSKPNPLIDFDNSAVFVNTELREWQANDLRIAGVSSFGISGTNAHVVLEEYINKNDKEQLVNESNEVPYLFTVSAKNKESLKAVAAGLYKYLINAKDSLGDISYTLNTGRKHFKDRLSMIASSKEELLSKFQLEMKILLSERKQFIPDKVIMVFSDEIYISPILKTALCKKYPVFKSLYESCTSILGSRLQVANFDQFAFKYSFYGLLVALGIKSQYMVGDGIGKLVIAVLTHKVSLNEAIDQALDFVKQQESDFDDRLKALIEKEKNNTTLFVEMGTAGNISSGLRKLQDNNSRYEVVSIDDGDNDVLQALKKFCEYGFLVNWIEYPYAENCRKIELPGYQFKRTRCWIKEPLLSKVENWFYNTIWIKEGFSTAAEQIRDKVFLVITDHEGLAGKVIAKLEAWGNTCVQVDLHQNFLKISDSRFQLNFSSEKHFYALAESLLDQGLTLDGILFLASYADRENLNESTVSALMSPFYCVKAFSNYLKQDGFKMTFITSNANQVHGNDHNIIPHHATIPAFVKGVLSEYPMLDVHHIDLESDSRMVNENADNILDEISRMENIRFISFRSNERYVQQLQKLEFDRKALYDQMHIKENGVYIISGGASGIGFEIGKYMARQVKARLIILGRTKLSSNGLHGERENDKAKNLNVLRNLGSVVNYYAVDVGDFNEMQEVFNSIGNTVDKIDGVIHCAGNVFNDKRTVEKTYEDIVSVLTPKVSGTILLDRFSHSLNPDFFVLFSSLNAIVPQKNSTEYAMANAFEDAYASYKRSKQENFISIQWPGWNKNEGNESSSIVHESVGGLRSLSTQDGLLCLHYALGLNHPTVAIANADLDSFRINPFFRIKEVANNAIHSSEQNQPSRKSETIISNGVLTLPMESGLTETELRMWAIWYDVLKNSAIRIDDDFFDLGGHSLNGSQVINNIAREFKVNIEFDTLLEVATIRSLSQYIDSDRGSAVGVVKQIPAEGTIDQKSENSKELTLAAKEKYYHASFGQSGLFLKYLFRKERSPFNMFRMEEFSEFNRDIFDQAFNALIQRHESLRTTLDLVEGEVRQQIHSGEHFSVTPQYVDLSGESDDHAKTKKVSEILAECFSIIFDLEKGPLIDVKAVRLVNTKYLILLSIDHIISDALSMEVLIKELKILYRGIEEKTTNILPELKVQFKDYANWQYEFLRSEERKVHQQFWCKYLSDYKGLTLPEDFISRFDFDNKSYKSTLHHELQAHFREMKEEEEVLFYGKIFSARPLKGGAYKIFISESLSKSLHHLVTETNSSLFAVLMAGLHLVIENITEADDVVIGTPVNVRDRKELNALIGWFLDTLLVRNRSNRNASVGDFIRGVSENIKECLAHRIYPFEMILHDQDVSIEKLGTVFLNLINVNVKSKNIIVPFQPYHTETGTPTFKLNFTFHEYPNGMELICDYRSDLFKKEKIQRIVSEYVLILEDLVSAPLEKATGLDGHATLSSHE